MVCSKRKYIFVLFLALVLILVFALNVLAVDDFSAVEKAIDNQTLEDSASPDIGVNLIKLVCILGLIIAAAWSIVRFLGKKVNNRLQGTWIHVVDEIMLGQNRGIVLCEAGARLYAVGVTDHNISVLFEVTEPEMLEEIRQSNLAKLGSRSPSLNWRDLKEKVSSYKKPHNTVPKVTESFHTLMEQQVQRLEDLSNRRTQYEMNSRRSDNNE